MGGQEELPGAMLLSPEGMEHVRKTIDNIFGLFEQVAQEIEKLGERVEQLESSRHVGSPPKDGRKYWFDQESGEWIPFTPRL